MKMGIIVAVTLLALAGIAAFFFLQRAMAGGAQVPGSVTDGQLWDLQTMTLEGEALDLESFAGKAVLVVNVASKCGLTPQYEGLEALYQEFRDEGLIVLGFPSNDFLGQEPGTAEEIREFCTVKFDVTFPMMAKIKVKGDEKDAVYKFLTAGGLEEPTWNFTKYLISRSGQAIARFGPKTTPDDEELVEAVKAALAEPEG